MSVGGSRFPSRLAGAARGVPPRPAAAVAGGYPVRLDARLEEPLNRWLWLVKWVLLIPHVLVLGLLWTTFALLTVVAGFAVGFTGRVPAYASLMTDVYPPFRVDLGGAELPVPSAPTPGPIPAGTGLAQR